MNTVPSPSRIDIIVHHEDAEWWQIVAALGPLFVFLGAVLIAAVGWFTLWRRTVADAAALDPDTAARGN